MEENPKVKLQEMDREGVKMANITHDSAPIDSGAISTRLVHKMSTSISLSKLFVCTAEYFCQIEIVFILSILQGVVFLSTSFQAIFM
ncbi:unnamed protein product [Hymenolepis diminuta]|uniref:Uncharacterized protein n=1 Tax=Hymenolepis diminuta TaxID=6216 RepID=A0A564Z1B4_HYMDI|nr:unnamed protein product [Hymenolepis diminuta]